VRILGITFGSARATVSAKHSLGSVNAAMHKHDLKGKSEYSQG